MFVKSMKSFLCSGAFLLLPTSISEDQLFMSVFSTQHLLVVKNKIKVFKADKMFMWLLRKHVKQVVPFFYRLPFLCLVFYSALTPPPALQAQKLVFYIKVSDMQ